jgi:hypothetical protein
MGNVAWRLILLLALALCPGCGYDRYAWGQPNPPSWGEPDPPSKGLLESFIDSLFKGAVDFCSASSANGWR